MRQELEQADGGDKADASAARMAPDSPAQQRGRGAEMFFALTLFVSAALLFFVQPMFAKMVLPLLGGAPSVWNTCLVFYQAALLAGYLYAHLSLRWLGPRRQAALHLLLLGLPWLVLPTRVAQGWLPPAGAFPVPWLWMLLTVSVGLPFLLVSASAPMLQAWFSHTASRSARDPYFLYAASNLGSLLALLGYPLVIESQLTLAGQTWWWAAGYALLTALVAGCAVRLWRSPAIGSAVGKQALRAPTTEQGQSSGRAALLADRPSVLRRLHWLALSLVPSSLLLGVTTHISTDIAAMPLLWVIPLALYLLTFVLVFARRPLVPLAWTLRVQPYLLVVAAGSMLWAALLPWTAVLLGSLHLLAFFATAMVCHGQLAADRPASSRLTEFYLLMSLGGVLGGVLNTLVAPLVFSGVWEYPLLIAAACLLRPWPSAEGRQSPLGEWALPAAVLLLCGAMAFALRSEALLAEWQFASTMAAKVCLVAPAAAAAFLLRRRPLPFAAGVAALLALTVWLGQGDSPVLHVERSFFGVLRVEYDPMLNAHRLMHGSTIHGIQSLDEKQRHEPWTYYHRKGPLGRIVPAVQQRQPSVRIGVLGLGAGAIASYGRPGDEITYYEIDPAVERIARKYFTHLDDCRAKVEVILGDARLSLAREEARQFDLLVVDVFSSDSVPIHLLTREALQIYLRRLAPRGLLAIHISNRYLDLQPVLSNLAEDAGVAARVCEDVAATGSDVLGKNGSTWVVMARRAKDLGPLVQDSDWTPLAPGKGRLWTDDFSRITAAVRWGCSWDWLRPATWWESDKAGNHVTVGTALFRQGKIGEAIVRFRKALEINPNYVEAHSNLGEALRQQGNLDEAIAQYQKALAIQPNHAGVLYNLGNVLFGQKDFDGAIAQYQKALAANPKYDEAQNNLGLAYFEQGRVVEAMACYRTTLEINPRYAKAYYNLGNALYKQGQMDEALTQYQKALEIDPNYALTQHMLGVTLFQQAKLAEAIGHLETALNGNPNFAETHRFLGYALHRQGRVAEALAQWREVIRLQPDSIEVLEQAALILATSPDASVRNGAEAVELAQRAVQLSASREPTALEILAAAYAAAGRFADAVAAAQQALELAVSTRQTALARSIQTRLELYRAGQPYRQAPH